MQAGGAAFMKKFQQAKDDEKNRKSVEKAVFSDMKDKIKEVPPKEKAKSDELKKVDDEISELKK